MTSKQNTQQKILDAAERLFAETGFAATLVAVQITELFQAEVNLASVNYHFRSKKRIDSGGVATLSGDFNAKTGSGIYRIAGITTSRDDLSRVLSGVYYTFAGTE